LSISAQSCLQCYSLMIMMTQSPNVNLFANFLSLLSSVSFNSLTCYLSPFDIPFNYSYPLISIGFLLLKLFLFVQIAFWPQLIHCSLALIVISLCLYHILSATRSLIWYHLLSYVVISFNYSYLPIFVKSCLHVIHFVQIVPSWQLVSS